MFPLCRPGTAAPDYLTLPEALQRGLAEVSEVSESGSVPNLRFLNKGEQPVLLLDGEELAGAKQNRVLNLTILVPAQTTLDIPVSCVERGRWSWRSRRFAATGAALHARARAAKAAAVSESLRYQRRAASDQGAIWAEIDRKAAALKVESPTAAMADIYTDQAEALDRIRTGIRAIPDQVGAVFAINGVLAGLELFAAGDTLVRHLPKLVDSYAMDALEADGEAPPPAVASVHALLAEVGRSRIDEYKAIGLGHDWRMSGRQWQGAGLAVEGRVVHLEAYPVAQQAA